MIVKLKVLLLVFLCIPGLSLARQNEKDSLNAIIKQHKGGNAGIDAMVKLSYSFLDKPDSMILYAQEGLTEAKNNKYKRGEAACLFLIALGKSAQKDYKNAIKYSFEARSAYENLKDYTGIVEACLLLQGNYRDFGYYRSAVTYAFTGEKIAEEHNVKGRFTFFNTTRLAPLLLAEMAQSYVLMNKLDSAIYYTQKSIAMKELFNGYEWNFPVYLLATYQTIKGDYKTAYKNYRQSLELASFNGQERDVAQNMSGMTTLFIKTGQVDSAIFYANNVITRWTGESEIKNLLESVSNLALAYKLKGNADSALKYTELHYSIQDSAFDREKDRELQRVSFDEELKQQEIITAQAKYKGRVQLFALSGGLLVLLVIAGILWRNNLQKQKAKLKIEQAYDHLKATQQQLIQSEKMASLGELTAGIAHEIQNPLNFVNNFSEVSNEMLEEIKENLASGDVQQVAEIAGELGKNLEKILHHGKRADAIVKGMLQHSRTSSGKMEPVNLNALADEYLRLSYHGLKARDKSFNVSIKTEYDEGVDKIKIIPQDIGRVLLNLYNNAFYAVDEKAKMEIAGYEPTIFIETKKADDKIFISVKDNGNGIPENIIHKIFQPFFTTKPTGVGTGLGLSISYDIVKAHNGKIEVKGTSEGTEFKIVLPAITSR